uniref:Secreted protein n=1 Tax=Amblyomma triste TaxID=251400 RepID=A0A023G2F3_AMBTT
MVPGFQCICNTFLSFFLLTFSFAKPAITVAICSFLENMNGLGAAFLLVIGVTACAAYSTTKEDLRKALNTEQKIWVVKRSYTRSTGEKEHKCVYATKDSLEEDNYEFHQGYKVGEEWKKENYMAYFPRMVVLRS